ncbi:MAG: ATP-binding cassette domain-containing protein [Pseudomonadota bacterium]
MPDVFLRAVEPVASEGSFTGGVFSVVLDEIAEAAITGTIEIIVNGFTAEAKDLASLTAQYVILPGQESAGVLIPYVNDDAVEGRETYGARIVSASPGTTFDDGVVEGAILDDDAAPNDTPPPPVTPDDRIETPPPPSGGGGGGGRARLKGNLFADNGAGRDDGDDLFVFSAAQGTNERIFLSFPGDVVKNDLPDGGRIIVRPDGKFTYISPNETFSNADRAEFRYTASDEAGQQSTANVVIRPGRKGGDNTLTASNDGGTLKGFGGDDTLRGRNKKDKLDGGKGNDDLDGGGGNDVLVCGKGNDNGKGGAGSDVLRGGTGNDKLDGEEGNDRVFGQAGDDDLFAGLGKDLLNAGKGNDDLFLEQGRTTAIGGKGRDDFIVSLFSGGGNHVIRDFRLGQDDLSFTGLSGGQQQRVSVAFAVSKKAAVLIFDEPTAQGDKTRLRFDDVAKNKREAAEIETFFLKTIEDGGMDWLD